MGFPELSGPSDGSEFLQLFRPQTDGTAGTSYARTPGALPVGPNAPGNPNSFDASGFHKPDSIALTAAHESATADGLQSAIESVHGNGAPPNHPDHAPKPYRLPPQPQLPNQGAGPRAASPQRVVEPKVIPETIPGGPAAEVATEGGGAAGGLVLGGAAVAGGALYAATAPTPPVSREQGQAIHDQEIARNKQILATQGNGPHALPTPSPYSNQQYVDSLPTAQQLRTSTRTTPAPTPGASPRGPVVANPVPRSAPTLQPSKPQYTTKTTQEMIRDHAFPASVKVKDADCIVRNPQDVENIRRGSFIEARENFVKKVASSPEGQKQMKAHGFTDKDIERAKQEGKLPPGWQVHHLIPLQCMEKTGDTEGQYSNRESNLVIMRSLPMPGQAFGNGQSVNDHQLFTNAQKAEFRENPVVNGRVKIQMPVPAQPGYFYN